MPINCPGALTGVKAVILDYGEVLCIPPTAEDIEASARILDINSDLFHALWQRNRDLYDRGDLSTETYWRRFAEDAGKPLGVTQLRELAERDVAMWGRLNAEMISWLQRLTCAGIKTAILSNMHLDMVRHALANFQWLGRVHSKTFSAQVRLIKPDPAIYEHCLRELAIVGAEALFIDDRQANIDAARAMGVHGIQFKSIAQLRIELEAAGFPILP